MAGLKSMRRRDGEELLDPDFVRAISHPIRVEILAECSLAPICVSEYIARRKPNLSRQAIENHFSILSECRAIEEVKVRRAGGRRVRYYAATARALFDEEDFNRMPPAVRGSVTALFCSTLYERIQESLLAGTIDAHPERHLSWSPLKLDREGFMALTDQLETLFDNLKIIEYEAQARMAETSVAPMEVTVALMGFESPPPVRDHPVERDPRPS